MAAYDVFISHCGADCKRDFAVWLKTELENVGIQCFFDEHSLEVGDVAATKMLDAMETATYGIVILSPGFFEREWCMKELQTFTKRGKVVPIFYGGFEEVQDARRAAIAGRVWESFVRFVRTEEEYVAVAAANTERTGVRLAEEGWWSSCIRKVRDEALKLLGKEKGGFRISEYDLLVGQHEHLVKLKRLLGVPEEGRETGASSGLVSQEVGIVGVKGMGGVGKSTLAKKLYDESDVREWFSGGICWLEVGPKPSDAKIQNLQRQILQRICKIDEDVTNPTWGRKLLKERLSGKRALICLDDVWEDCAMATQVVTAAELGSGSCVLKTARVREAIGGVVHDLDVLGAESARELFWWHAFRGEKPDNARLVEAAEEAAMLCGGLPLALALSGRQVACSSNKQGCLDQLVAFLKTSHGVDGCGSIIRRSYEELPPFPPGLRDTFVLIAWVWPRTFEFVELQQAVENVAAAVHGKEPIAVRWLLARKALESLASRSLIKLERAHWSFEGASRVKRGFIRIEVHDLISGVAEGLANEASSDPTRFFRSPRSEQTMDRLTLDLEHIYVSSSESMMVSFDHLATSNNKVLSFVFDLETKSSDLVLGQQQSPCKLLSINRGGAIKLAAFRNLQCLRLVRCTFDPPYPKGLEQLENLNVLQIKLCSALVALPQSLERMTGLTSLDLEECPWLKALPESIGQLKGLTALYMANCASLSALPGSLVELETLTTLDLAWCKSLTVLPMSVGKLTGLTELDLGGCLSLTALPELVGHLTGLKELSLVVCISLTALPESVSKLTGLKELDLRWCESLTALPESVGHLAGLNELDLRLCKSLTALPESVGQMTGLTKLNLDLCKSLTALPDSLGQLTGLTKLDLKHCKSLEALPESIKQLTKLTELNLEYCKSLTALPESVGQLSGLEVLDLKYCTGLTALPVSMVQLTGLRKLDLGMCESLTLLPELVGLLNGLSKLGLEYSHSLTELPESVGQRSGLTKLYVDMCESLMLLPKSMALRTGLTELYLNLDESPELRDRANPELTKLYLDASESLTAEPIFHFPYDGHDRLDKLAARPELHHRMKLYATSTASDPPGARRTRTRKALAALMVVAALLGVKRAYAD